jgi:uncharacterized protein (DUF736 family)
MTQIGNFERTANGYDGRIYTLNLDARISIVPAAASDTENVPDWRIYLGDSDTGPEIGAGWNRIGEKAGAYISLQIDCPSLPQPIHANLFQSNSKDGLHHLLWNRPQRRDERI